MEAKKIELRENDKSAEWREEDDDIVEMQCTNHSAMIMMLMGILFIIAIIAGSIGWGLYKLICMIVGLF